MEKERIIWLDYAKAFAIILVVVGHAIEMLGFSAKDLGGVLHYFIYCFHMPYFYILSGISYGISRSKNSHNAVGRLKYTFLHCFDFLWVLVIFNVLTDLPMLVLHPESMIEQGLVGIAIKWLNHFWYIAVLCLIYVIVPWIKCVNLKLIAALLCAAWLCGIAHMGVAKFLLYLVCFLLGIYLAENDTSRVGGKSGIIFLIGSMIWFFITDGATLMDVYSKTILGLTGSMFLIDALRTRQDKTRQDKTRQDKTRTLACYRPEYINYLSYTLLGRLLGRLARVYIACGLIANDSLAEYSYYGIYFSIWPVSHFEELFTKTEFTINTEGG